MTPDTAIHFLLWLLIVASVVAVVASRLRIPYTVALVIGGLVLGSLHHLPMLQILSQGQRPNWLTPQVVLVLFLPPLLFEGSIRVNARLLRENLVPIMLLANLGVVAATLITGLAIHWAFQIPFMIALLFGSIISATDPISVLSIFEEMGVCKRLSMIVEGESLFNDGTAVVLFGILLEGVSTGHLNVGTGLVDFAVVVLGAATVGSFLGYLASKITQRIDDARVEITLTTILAYSSYLLAQSLHLSGVIATVAAGIVLGNLGTRSGMSSRTQLALWSFWGYAAFVINSLLFLLIGMQVRIGDLARGWHTALLAIAAVLLGRILSVYGLTPLSNLLSEPIPLRWQHILVWGGLRGALALALALSLQPTFPYRAQLLAWTFGVVAFSLMVQGLTVKPLLRMLGMAGATETEYDRVKASQIALSSARAELDELLDTHTLSAPLYARIRRELDSSLAQAGRQIAELYTEDAARAQGEMRAARSKLLAAEREAIQRAFYDGLISQQTADKMMDAADRQMDELEQKLTEGTDGSEAGEQKGDDRGLRPADATADRG
ncbi:MAG TPA: Na+/H+ antiporter [Terriglobia bacterium]|nr:Na+/H+ antiporter [Terriglobia bacterium]